MALIAETLESAIRNHQAGRLREAEQLYRQVLQAVPGHAEALHYLSVLAFQVGNYPAAIEMARADLILHPGDARFHATLGLALQPLGRFDEALASLREAARLLPASADTHYNLANALKRQGQLAAAAVSYQHALLLNPEHASAHHNLANVYQELGQLEPAVDHYRQTLRLNPRHAEAHHHLGNALRQQGQLVEAAASYRQALLLKPQQAQTHNNLGSVLQDLGECDGALASYQQALRCDPNLAATYLNLTNLLRAEGRLEEAIAWAQQLVQRQPQLAAGYLQLGKLFAANENLEHAVACFRQALHFEPDCADTHALLGTALIDLDRAHEGVASLQEAIRLRPTARLRVMSALCLPLVYQSLAELESWRNRLLEEIRRLRESQVVLDVTREPVRLLFFLAYQGKNDRDIQQQVARLHQAPVLTVPTPTPRAGSRNRKIRVGFVSAYFRVHTIGHLMQGLVAQLARDDFEVAVLSLDSRDDAVANFFKEHADRYLEVPGNLGEARRLIAEQQLDVLFYTDIGMDPIASTLACSRLAPVQCVTWGHPSTTGRDTIDYFISSEALETDEAEQHYTETLVRLKTLPIYYYRPEPRAPLAARADFGLANDEHVYACPQSTYKFHPSFDELLGGILRGDPRGTLVLLEGLRPHVTQLLRQRLTVTMPDVMDRVRFLPMQSRPDYLNLLAVVDVLLDPIHFGGGNTSYEGLALGTPIVTLPSQFLRGRITFALYQQMQVFDCVVATPQEYVARALRLGTDPSYRAAVHRKILDSNGVLFENSAGIRELEEFFRRAVSAAFDGSRGAAPG